MNTAGKTIFSFSGRPEKMVFPKMLRWNMIFLVLSGKMIFLFPKIWSYTLDGKWKMIFLKKKHGNMIFSLNLLKIWSFQRVPHRHMIFLVLSGKVVSFSRNMTFLPWAESEKRPFPGNTWKNYASLSEKKPGNLILRVEVWPLPKFIGLELFHNE